MPEKSSPIDNSANMDLGVKGSRKERGKTMEVKLRHGQRLLFVNHNGVDLVSVDGEDGGRLYPPLDLENTQAARLAWLKTQLGTEEGLSITKPEHSSFYHVTQAK